MQVDQFESEVELLSVQTRKKKGDKEVGVLYPLWCGHSGLLPCLVCASRLFFSLYSQHRLVGLWTISLTALPSPLLSPSLLSCKRGQTVCPSFISCVCPDEDDLADHFIHFRSHSLALKSSPQGPHIEIALWVYSRWLGRHSKHQAAPASRLHTSYLQCYVTGYICSQDPILCKWRVLVRKTFL